MLNLSSRLSVVPHIGPQYAKKLESHGLVTIKDLLFYVPFRYEDYREVSTTQNYTKDTPVVLEGVITAMIPLPSKKGKSMIKGVFKDSSGELPVIWFNQPFLFKSLKKNFKMKFIGKIQDFSNIPTLISPVSTSIQDNDPHTGRIVPVYSEFNGITYKWIRARIFDVLLNLKSFPDSIVPELIEKSRSLMKLEDAIRLIHFPQTFEDVTRARYRLGYEEVFGHILKSDLIKSTTEEDTIETNYIDPRPFYETLPFMLGQSQLQAIAEISEDIKSQKRLNRIVIGDVGSGKTIVAASVMYSLAKAGKKSIIMAPTQILAAQHAISLAKFFEPHGVHISEVSSNNENVNMFTDIVVGTHALLHRNLNINDVGLVVIDEQHRFGVGQRELLKEKFGKETHFLSMTATPIPRSLSLVTLGHLDVTYLESRDDGRKPAITKVVPYLKRNDAYRWVASFIKERGGQAFVVCPFISPSESIESVKSATSEFDVLSKGVFSSLKVCLLHGGMKPTEKDSVLSEFRDKKFDVLVTTPVVEVGIDIPNANFIVIESAERFGLAQLHQLRGRVGRAGQMSYCFLVPSNENSDDNKRLEAMESTHDGFKLAEIDLKSRGAGTILGTMQHGFALFSFADVTDHEFIIRVKADVMYYIKTLSMNDQASLLNALEIFDVSKGKH